MPMTKVLYILVLAFIDARTGETIEEHRGNIPLTFDACSELLAPDHRGPVLVKDGKAEVMWCEAIKSDVSKRI